MNKTQDYLIELLNAYLKSEAISLNEEINYNTLFELSHAHNLSAIIFCVLNTATNKEIVDAKTLRSFEEDFLESVVRYDYQKAQISEIEYVFTKEHIQYVFFKGAALKELYPVPQARIMSDIDVLIHGKDRVMVRKFLSKYGFVLLTKNGPVNTFRKDKLLVEVHNRLVSGKVGSSSAEELFSDAISHAEFNGMRGEFDASYHFAYLITHIAHHFWFNGAGVRHILDLAVMLKAHKIDLDAVLELLARAELKDFAKNIISVCHNWFGEGVLYNENTEKIEEFIFSYGVFGSEGRNKAAVVTRKDMESGKKGGAVATRFRLLFPSYEQVKNIPYIPFIEGRPYLLPAAWVYRFFYNMKNRRAFIEGSTKDIGKDVTKKEAERELELFEEIGLL